MIEESSDHQVFSEVTLKMDFIKSESMRKYDFDILNYLGLVGGFAFLMQMLFENFGLYFSRKYFAASISKSLYIKKKSRD